MIRFSQTQTLAGQGKYEYITFNQLLNKIGSIKSNATVKSNIIKHHQPCVKFLDDEEQDTALVLDFDDLKPESFRSLLDRLPQIGHCIWYTTSTHTDASPRIRVIFPIEPMHADLFESIKALQLPDADSASYNRIPWSLPYQHVSTSVTVREIPGNNVTAIEEDEQTTRARLVKQQRNSEIADLVSNEEHHGMYFESFQTECWKVFEEPRRFQSMLEEIELQVAGFKPKAKDGLTLIGTAECPCCMERKLTVRVGMFSGSLSGRCFNTNCPSVHESIPSIKFSSFFTPFARQFKQISIRHCDRIWWCKDGKTYSDGMISRCFEQAFGIDWFLMYNNMRTLTTSTYDSLLLTPFDSKIIDTSFPRVDSQLRDPKLFVVKGDRPSHMLLCNFDGHMLPRPKGNLAGVEIKPGHSLWKAMVELGLKAHPRHKIEKSLRRLTPFVWIVPPGLGRQFEQEQTMFKQRVSWALARGCTVLVPIQFKSVEARSFMKKIGIARTVQTPVENIKIDSNRINCIDFHKSA